MTENSIIQDILLSDEKESGFYNFVPRPDDEKNFDQQASFCYNRDKVSFLIGGNAAGTTEAAAFKTGLFLVQQQPPPRHDTPFWILSNTFDQVCGTCWLEKLQGHGHLPKHVIDWGRVSWYNKAKGYPLRVPLKPWYKGQDANWCLEFKSYEQGRQALQARSIGGFWFSEQFPMDIFVEVLRGCRDYMFPGGQFAEFTPINPDLCAWVEGRMNNPPDGWKFYRANTMKNKVNLADGWFEQFFDTVPDEMVATRMTGALASFEGVIFQSFSKKVHVVDKVPFDRTMKHFRGVDWGATQAHPFVCLWGCVDPFGTWYIYDEYWDNDQTKILADHINVILNRSRDWGYPRTDEYDPMYGACYADPSRRDNIAEFGKAGITVIPAFNNVLKGIDCLRAKLKVDRKSGKTHLYIHSRCTHLVEEMRKYRWRRAKGALDGVLNPEVPPAQPMKIEDDTVDALRYMITTHFLQNGGEFTLKTYKRDDIWNPGVYGGHQ